MHEHLIETAFKELFPEKECSYHLLLTYSRKFSGFHGNIRFGMNTLDIRMSKQMKQVAEEIRIGLIQILLLKVFKSRKNSGEEKQKSTTTNMDLYNTFLKNVHIAVPKEVESPLLLERFNKLNDQFFHGLLEQPSLHWGNYSRNKLGSYEYGTDTILLSKHLENAPAEYLEYVLYHEMLHKKHKFTHKNGRSLFHSPAFKDDEAQFPRAAELEKEIPQFIARKRSSIKPRTSFFFWKW